MTRDLLLSGLIAGLACCTAASPASSPLLNRFQYEGFWQDRKQPDYLVLIEEGRYLASVDGQVRFAAEILELAEAWMRLCEDGQESTREISSDSQSLVIHDPRTGETRYFRRLSERPRDLSLVPLPLPAPMAVPVERVRQIEGELRRRVQADQDAQRPLFNAQWSSRGQSGQDRPLSHYDLRLISTQSENTRRLKQILSEVGWIDSQRFGLTATDDAFLLTQHSKDLPLMLAVLPRIKEEVQAGRLQGETYALLYDRVQLLLGKYQRYGTRMGKDASGQAVVLPTEEPEKVDERRKELGIAPLSESVRIFGAAEVRFSSACRRAADRR